MNAPWSMFHVLVGGLGLLAALGLTRLAYRKFAPQKVVPLFKQLAIIHILVGGLGLLAVLSYALMFAAIFQFQMDSPEFVIGLVKLLGLSGPFMVAGLLYAFSGFLLWRSSNKVSGKLVLLQELTVVLLILHCLMVAFIYGTQLELFQLPAGFVLLMLIELGYLRFCWSKGRGLTTG